MFGKGKLLLAGIFFTAVCKVTMGNKLVDVASDVIDDLYEGCHKEAMEKFITSGLLKKELDNSEGFQKAWNKSAQCSSLIPGGIREHTAALSVFLDGDEAFLKQVNNAVETMGANLTTYENDFHFKSLHFLLMDSIKQLTKPNMCKTWYFLPTGGDAPKLGSAVRFAGFTVVDSNTENLQDFAGEILLKIESCFFAILGDHTCKEKLGSVLISPAEVFTVEAVSTQQNNDDEDYTEVLLKHLALNSTHNCFMFSRSTSAQPNQAPGLLPLAPLLAVLSLWSLSI